MTIPDELDLRLRWILRRMRAAVAQSARDPGVVEEIIERAVEEATREDAAPIEIDEEPVDAEIRRMRRRLLEARRRRKLRALLPIALPSREWIRERVERVRCQVTTAGAACLGSVSDTVASVLVATTILGGAASLSQFAGTAFASFPETPQSLLQAAPAMAPPAQPLTLPSALPSDRDVAVGASVSSPTVDPAAPVGTRASAEVGRENRRIGIGKSVSASVGDHKVENDGPLMWFECDPRSTVASTICRAYDAAAPDEGNE